MECNFSFALQQKQQKMFSNIKEPKKKSFKQKDTLVPLPIPILYSNETVN